MKNKRFTVKILIDIGMTICLLLLMPYSLLSETAHEWIGMAMLVLFISHHILNCKWLLSIRKGKYNAFRVIQTVLVVISNGKSTRANGYLDRLETPTWWYTMEPAVLTLLTANNFTGKLVIPFMTNGGWPGHVIKDMKENCQGATFAHEMQIQFDSNGKDHLETSEDVITEWIGQINTDIKQ